MINQVGKLWAQRWDPSFVLKQCCCKGDYCNEIKDDRCSRAVAGRAASPFFIALLSFVTAMIQFTVNSDK